MMQYCYDYQLSKVQQKFWSPGFNMKIVLLSWATGFASSGNLVVFKVIGSKACKIVGDAISDARLLIFLPKEMK